MAPANIKQRKRRPRGTAAGYAMSEKSGPAAAPCKPETGKAKADEQNRRRLRDRCGNAGSELVHRRGRERFVINSKVIDDAVETEDPGDSKVLRGEGG